MCEGSADRCGAIPWVATCAAGPVCGVAICGTAERASVFDARALVGAAWRAAFFCPAAGAVMAIMPRSSPVRLRVAPRVGGGGIPPSFGPLAGVERDSSCVRLGARSCDFPRCSVRWDARSRDLPRSCAWRSSLCRAGHSARCGVPLGLRLREVGCRRSGVHPLDSARPGVHLLSRSLDLPLAPDSLCVGERRWLHWLRSLRSLRSLRAGEGRRGCRPRPACGVVQFGDTCVLGSVSEF